MNEKNERKTVNEEEEKDNKLLRRAFRWSYPMSEKLVSQRLIQANFSHEASVIIPNTTIAADITEAEKKQVKGLDFELLRGIDRVNTSFRNVEIIPLDRWKTQLKYYIPWSLDKSQENYQKIIKPWRVPAGYHHKFITVHRKLAKKIIHHHFRDEDEFLGVFEPEEARKKVEEWKKRDRCPRCGDDFHGIGSRLEMEDTTVVNPLPEWSFFWESTGCLTRNGYKSLLGAFESWAKTRCARASAIMANLVSPGIYDKMTKLLSKDRTEDQEKD